MDDLKRCLDSIMKQTQFPKEIIIVDDSENDLIRQCLDNYQTDLRISGIALKYIRNYKDRSLTIARNIGINAACEDLILFLDDDVILNNNYLEEISRVYQKYPDASGVQGNIINYYHPNLLTNLYNKLFFLDQIRKNTCRALPSTFGTYPASDRDFILNCEWLSGCNQSYKSDILKDNLFDENLKKYCYKEDLDLSYRIYKKSNKLLFITSHAKCIHNVSSAGRIPKEEKIVMEIIYSIYIFYKDFEQTKVNKAIFIWSRIGYITKNLLESLLKKPRHPYLSMKYQLRGYNLGIKHICDIKNGDLSFFNEILE